KSFVVTLADLNDVQVELDINQNDFNRIVSGQACTVVTDAYPDKKYDCIVDEIAPEANRQKATIQVKVKYLKPDEFVKPEMNARVTFLLPDQRKKDSAADATKLKMYSIPKSAVLDRDGGKAVFIVKDGVAQSKSITLGSE